VSAGPRNSGPTFLALYAQRAGRFDLQSLVQPGAYGLENIVTADFDLDGVSDFFLGICEYGGFGNVNQKLVRGLSRVPADPGGTTFEATPAPTLNAASLVAVGDIEPDGVPEVVVASSNGSSTTTLWLYTTTTHGDVAGGTLLPLTELVINNFAAATLVLADLDGDGRSELLVGDSGHYASPHPTRLAVYPILPAAPYFGVPVVRELAAQGTPYLPISVTIENLDADPEPELAVEYANAFAAGSGVAHFDGSTITFAPLAVAGRVCDVNADHEPDVIAASANQVLIYLGPIAASPVATQTLAIQGDDGVGGVETATLVTSLVADMDGDGHRDIVAEVRLGAPPYEYRVWVFRQTPGSATPFAQIAEQWRCGLEGATTSTAVTTAVDVDGDLQTDLLRVVGTSGISVLTVYPRRDLHGTTPSCAAPGLGSALLTTGAMPLAPQRAVFDLNDNRLPDLVTLEPQANRLNVWSPILMGGVPTQSHTLAEPRLALPRAEVTSAVALPRDRGGRARVADRVALIRPRGLGPNMAMSWRDRLRDDGVTLAVDSRLLTAPVEVAGIEFSSVRRVSGQLRHVLAPRLGPIVTLEPRLVRAGLNLADAAGTGLIITLPVHSSWSGALPAEASVRVFERLLGPVRASAYASDSLATSPEADSIIAVEASLGGRVRPLRRQTSTTIEISTGVLTPGQGPRFDFDAVNRRVRVLIDAPGELWVVARVP